MEVIKHSIFAALIVTISVLIWRAVNFLWLKPKRIERCLKQQGIKGNSYKPPIGDLMELVNKTKESMTKPINLSDDTLPRIVAFIHHTILKHRKNCFAWIGPAPWLIISDPEKIKEMLTNYEDFRKPDHHLNKILMVGLFMQEGETWSKHRKIINPAFHMEKLKNMCQTLYEGCSTMINMWEEKTSKDESIELDVWPFLENLTGDLISRAAFGGNYEQGKRIFNLQTEYVRIALTSMQATNYNPGLSFLPTKTNRLVKEISKEMKDILTRMIDSRKKEMEEGKSRNDLLGMLLESNMREDKENGLTTKDVVKECQLFYLAGSETTSSLLAWTLILLSQHQIWQERARTEVLQAFGKEGKPDFDGLNRLKIVNMIFNEVLRLYPPGYMLLRKVFKDIQFQDLLIPEGTEVVMPICMLHQDCSIWGEDAKEFKPERFAEGVSEASKGQPIYFPFSVGPRICIGKNFALLEAKLVLTMILQHFSFELSPNYTHAPYAIVIVKPQHGVSLILRKLCS